MKTPSRPSAVLNALLLAETIGLTEGDRTFLAAALKDAATRAVAQGVTATALARAVFEGPAFADVLTGAPLPDRDDFKDRFVTGLNGLLQERYPATNGFTIKREAYASGPKYDRKLIEEAMVEVVPTTACLRCHDVRPSGKPRPFEPIPALSFDPFDKAGREAWLRSTKKDRRELVLKRLQERLFTDSDMPPEDAPDYQRFRVQEDAAFTELKDFVERELEKARTR